MLAFDGLVCSAIIVGTMLSTLFCFRSSRASGYGYLHLVFITRRKRLDFFPREGLDGGWASSTA